MPFDHISTQAFPFMQRATEAGLEWPAPMESAMELAHSAGLVGWEPIVRNPDQVDVIGVAARRHGLGMPSLYVGGIMHERATGQQTFDNMLGIAEKAVKWGTKLMVINPNPVDWKEKLDKSDSELTLQRELLTELGRRFGALGLKLCYHTHDAEMRASAREFHHMLTASDPEIVRLCLDPHWIYRGAGNSEIALHDIITHYGKRIEMIHLRQSAGGVWDETVGPGDLDYERLARRVADLGLTPLLVIERALESGTPNKLGDLEAHRLSADYARQVFAAAAQQAAA